MASPGRPRVAGSPTGRGTRNDILHAGAELFCTVGYGSTSTHALAAAAGIRQASLYHHFGGKHEVLLELLLGTVQPSLDTARALLGRSETAESRLWALCARDVTLLSGGDTNIGSLYLLPELSDEKFAVFHDRRLELEDAYGALVAASGVAAASLSGTTALVLSLVESVILQRRREPETVDQTVPFAIADAALKILDVDPDARRAAHDDGARLLAALG